MNGQDVNDVEKEGIGKYESRNFLVDKYNSGATAESLNFVLLLDIRDLLMEQKKNNDFLAKYVPVDESNQPK